MKNNKNNGRVVSSETLAAKPGFVDLRQPENSTGPDSKRAIAAAGAIVRFGEAPLSFSTSSRPLSEFRSTATPALFQSKARPTRRFNVADLFEFKRRYGDFPFSLFMLALVLFLLWQFGAESGWNERDLPQKRVGKILKQPWIGPFICMCLLVPAALFNVWSSWRTTRRNIRLLRPDRTGFELRQWLRSFEYIAYFIAYTALMPIFGYLLSTVTFAVFLTWRLGYRSWRWIGIGFVSALTVVIMFRTILQIKTPVNIWLYNQLPPAMETFMKIYF